MSTLGERSPVGAEWVEDPQVRAEGLSFAYPDGTVALRDVDLDIAAGSITHITGDSGSGKTTLLRALSGLIPHFHGGHMSGTVMLAGRDTRRCRPEVLGRHAGVLFQEPERQAVHRSVLRDVAFGPGNLGMAPDRIRPAVEAALSDVGASDLIGRNLDELSGGERQRIALAGVIAAGQGLVLLDEPVSQIDEAGEKQLAEVIIALRQGGRAVVLSGHGSPAANLHADTTVTLATTNADAGRPNASFPVPGGRLLTAAGLCVTRGARTVIEGVDLALGAGEVRALTGANGSGKTSLLMALAGLLPLDAGEVRLGSTTVSGCPLSDRFPATALVPQDPRLYFLTEGVASEVGFSARARRGREVGAQVEEALARFALTGVGDRHPLDLSSGQAQRVALAAAWAQEPELLLLDEPTRGLDGRRRGLLIDALAAHAERGGAALVATHDPVLAEALPGSPVTLAEGRRR